MIVIEKLDQIPPLQQPIALTIGTFDGVHLGHQYLFQELKKRGYAVAVTFSNHPLDILAPQQAPTPLLPLSEKLELFKQHGIQMTLLIPFTQELSVTPYDIFLQNLHTALPFSTLVLGEDARLGARAEGDLPKIQALSKIIGFEALFLPKLTLDGEVISSRQIRELLKTNQTDKAVRYLGEK